MPEAPEALRRELRFWDLVFINISAVAGVRWLATAAHAGPGSITLWLLATVTFFIPSALVVSALSERFPQEGGFYVWIKHAFGDWSAFLSAWFYFVSNILYFPAMLLAGVLFLTGVWHESVLSAGLMLFPGPAMATAFSVPSARLGARLRLAVAEAAFGC